MMRRFAIASVLFVLACTATAQQLDTKKQSDLEKLQGTWWIVGLESGGKQQSDKGFKGNRFVFSTAKGLNAAVLFERGYAPVEFSFSLDPIKTPKEINLSTKGNKALGIYKLEGDDLTISMSLGGSRPGDFATRAGGDSETFTLKRNRWEQFTENGLAFSIELPGRPIESKRNVDGARDTPATRVLSVRNEMERATYAVSITTLLRKPAPDKVDSEFDAARKSILAALDPDADAAVESETKLVTLPSGVTAARELTITTRNPQSRDRGTMRLRLYVVGERIIGLAVSGTEEITRSPSVNRFWNSFRTPAEKRKDFPSRQR